MHEQLLSALLTQHAQPLAASPRHLSPLTWLVAAASPLVPSLPFSPCCSPHCTQHGQGKSHQVGPLSVASLYSEYNGPGWLHPISRFSAKLQPRGSFSDLNTPSSSCLRVCICSSVCLESSSPWFTHGWLCHSGHLFREVVLSSHLVTWPHRAILFLIFFHKSILSSLPLVVPVASYLTCLLPFLLL